MEAPAIIFGSPSRRRRVSNPVGGFGPKQTSTEPSRFRLTSANAKGTLPRIRQRAECTDHPIVTYVPGGLGRDEEL